MLSYHLLLIFGIAVTVVRADECPENYIQDGFCDPECNDENHEWDGGDCCEATCQPDMEYECGTNNGYNCLDPAVNMQYELEVDYEGFRLVMQCDREQKAGYAKRYYYSLTSDKEDLGTKRSYRQDKREDESGNRLVPDECQQWFTKSNGRELESYANKFCPKTTPPGDRKSNPECYDKGHVIMANHLDNTSGMRRDAAYATNILPQVAAFNQYPGAWRETEDLIECIRDIPQVKHLEVFGDMIYNDPLNDHYLNKTHGIPTPDVYYKVVVKHVKKPRPWSKQPTPEVIAWYMPNQKTTTKELLDKHYHDDGVLISIAKLVRLTEDQTIHDRLPAEYKQTAVETGESWENPWGKKCTRKDFKPRDSYSFWFYITGSI